jgi:ribosomal protein S4
VTEAELRQDLKNGQTLSQVAAAKNVTEADFKAKVVAALKTRLDAAVSAKTITQAQEDAQLAKLQAGDPPLWNKVHK